MIDEEKLNQLSRLSTPDLDSGKQHQAIQAGLAAFKSAQSNSIQENEDSQDRANQTSDTKTVTKDYQGKAKLTRLMSGFIDSIGEALMKNQLITSTVAASCLVLAVMIHHVTDKPALINPMTAQPEPDFDAPQESAKLAENELPENILSVNKPTEKTMVEAKKKDRALPSTIKEIYADRPADDLEGSADEILLEADIVQLSKTDSLSNTISQPAPRRQLADQKSEQFSAEPITPSTVTPSSLYAKPVPAKPTTGDRFESFESNSLTRVKDARVSTFSLDVDTASYSFMRRALNQGRLPNPDAIRVEELINYFDYQYAVPNDVTEPFKPTLAVYQTPWNANTKLIHIGIKGYEMTANPLPAKNLVFLLDVSGSMHSPDKLPLLQAAFKMMVSQLTDKDSVSIVTYAGNAGTVLQPTSGDKQSVIKAAIDQLQAGGGTAGHQGIIQAYALAKQSFKPNGINRIFVATDGDFNVGIHDPEQLKSFISKQKETGIYLSVLGFGQGNYNDALMQALAQNGNGNAAYIDNLNEAQKVLVEEANATLYPIANDVKIQVEFNPEKVAEYRLIGYETRSLKREDFNNDKVDAGDIGAGHSVTAIYEITPVGSAQSIDPLRYQTTTPKDINESNNNRFASEYAFLKIRYKQPGDSNSKLIQTPITSIDETQTVKQQAPDIQFAAAVAGFGQLLRNDLDQDAMTYKQVTNLANSGKGQDEFGYRSEFIRLVKLASSLDNR